jgi:hypothetical protein
MQSCDEQLFCYMETDTDDPQEVFLRMDLILREGFWIFFEQNWQQWDASIITTVSFVVLLMNW